MKDYDMTMTKAALLDTAAAHGVPVEPGATKTEIIAAMDAAETAQNGPEADGVGADTGAKENAAEGGAEATPEAVEQEETAERGGYTVFVYCGPSIPGGRLNENAILKGTREQVQDFYKSVLQDFPQADRLIVPVCKVADTKARVRTPGNIAYKHYHDIASAIRGKKEA